MSALTYRGRDDMAIGVLHDRAAIFLGGKHAATWERMFPESVIENPVSLCTRARRDAGCRHPCRKYGAHQLRAEVA